MYNYSLAKVTVYNLLKRKLTSTINLLGLAIGFACILVLGVFISNELSYDKYIEKKDRIYRAINYYSDVDFVTPFVPYPFSPSLKTDFPEIEESARTAKITYPYIKNGDSYIKEEAFQSADNEIFQILDFEILYGNPNELLRDKYSVVLTRDMALKYYNKLNAIGEILNIDYAGKKIGLKVTGIIENIPWNSTFQANFIGNVYLGVEDIKRNFFIDVEDDWNYNFVNTYILLKKGTSVYQLQKKMKLFEKRHLNDNSKFNFTFQNITDIYLHSIGFKNDFIPKGNISDIYIFSTITVFILLIVILNYVILSTAQTSVRFKEVGLRKVFGANRNNLIFQFLFESVFISVLSVPIAFLFSSLFLPYLNHFLPKNLYFDLFTDWQLIVYIIIISVLVGLMSGIYIAFYLASLSPTNALKSKFLFGSVNNKTKQLLTTFQLVLFLVSTICSFSVYKQMQFMKKADLGYTSTNLMSIIFDRTFFKDYGTFKNELEKNPNVLSVSGSVSMGPSNASSKMKIPLGDGSKRKVYVERYCVDYGFINTLKLIIIEGRAFSKTNVTDLTRALILNEKAVKLLNLKNPIGYKIGGMEIIGVINDFNLHSFHYKIEPAIFYLGDQAKMARLIVRLSPKNRKDVLSYIEKTWDKFSHIAPFHYEFFDDSISKLYQQDRNHSNILYSFTVLAIIISIFGLFGLTNFTILQRTKEIGIRKVFGASYFGIMGVFSREYVISLIIASIIAWPVSFFIIENWLQHFAYRTSINIIWYLLSSGVGFFVILLTLGYKVFIAAKLNPIDSLRYE